MYIITIDTGTTNTRVCLWDKEQVITIAKRGIGVRNTSIDGHNGHLRAAISDAIEEVLLKHKLGYDDIQIILASGMITSNLGLAEVPHETAPVDCHKLARNIQTQTFTDICPQAIHFIPGVKNQLPEDFTNLEAMDFMRGEEVEVFALMGANDITGLAVMVLPGSHTKFVAIDQDGRISACCTTLAGELNAVITENTILSSSLEKRFTDQLDLRQLLAGATSTSKVGFVRSLFSLRILEQVGKLDHHQLASFLLGAIIQSDIDAMLASQTLNYEAGVPVYIYGDSILGKAFNEVLKATLPNLKTHTLIPKEGSYLAGEGAILVAKSAGLI